jgi:hypothetical protein
MSNYTIQNIFKSYENYLASTPQPLKNRKAIHAITHCRTEVMGTSYFSCPEGHQPIKQHHSCRHRSCYLCAQKKRLEWIESQRSRLFNVPHFHVIFTLPHEYLSLWRYNEALMTQILFTASQQTLLELMGDKKYHGLTPGILMALHTWGRQLTLHPHTHCLVTAGGLASNSEWQSVGEYLLPIRVVKSLYRGKVQALLRAAFENNTLQLSTDMSERDFWCVYKAAYKKQWSVRIEERYEHGKGVMLYLARYLKGGPINPAQINQCTSKTIGFRYLDHRDKQTKGLKLSPEGFIKRLLQHVPAMGKHTVRFYGLYATSSKRRHSQCVDLLGNLTQVKTSGLKIKDMLLFCHSCGGQARLTHRVWGSQRKGNSINRDALQHRTTTFLQQDDTTDIANVLCKHGHHEIPP